MGIGKFTGGMLTHGQMMPLLVGISRDTKPLPFLRNGPISGWNKEPTCLTPPSSVRSSPSKKLKLRFVCAGFKGTLLMLASDFHHPGLLIRGQLYWMFFSTSPELAPLFAFLLFWGPFVFHSPCKKGLIFCWGPIFPA